MFIRDGHWARWQNGYCTGLENRRPSGLLGSNPNFAAVGSHSGIALAWKARPFRLAGSIPAPTII